MNDITNYKNIKAWPFVEAIKVLKKFENLDKKQTINFETGYGPSGVPHIGTFAEVLRTNMVRNALREIKSLDSNLITFSDDMDALKKVPEDYPYPDKLSKYLNFPAQKHELIQCPGTERIYRILSLLKLMVI